MINIQLPNSYLKYSTSTTLYWSSCCRLHLNQLELQINISKYINTIIEKYIQTVQYQTNYNLEFVLLFDFYNLAIVLIGVNTFYIINL